MDHPMPSIFGMTLAEKIRSLGIFIRFGWWFEHVFKHLFDVPLRKLLRGWFQDGFNFQVFWFC